jgi:uncharacterized protein YciI
MHFLLFYELSPDFVERRAPLRNEHLQLAWAAEARGELVLAGTLAEPIDKAVLLFRGDSPAVVSSFVQSDPYVREGLVLSWRVRPWTTSVGSTATNPTRPDSV